MTAKPTLSVIVPCFNERDVIDTTHRRLVDVLGAAGVAFEIVYVDDGSADATPDLLRGLQAGDGRVRVVQLSRNFGHQMAATAGIDHARGDALVLIDADLQDPPELIPEMVRLWRQGAAVVYGRRTDRVGETAFKVWTAKAFYRLINRLSDTEIPLDTGDFRLIDRKVAAALAGMPERDRFVRGMVSWVGFRQVALPYQRAAQFAGTSKYPFRKMVRFAVDGLLSFSLAPLRLAITIGFCASAVSVLGILYALVLRLFTQIWVSGWTLMFIAMMFLGGMQLLSLGVIGEYVGRIYREVKRRPLYVVAERLGFAPGDGAAAEPGRAGGRTDGPDPYTPAAPGPAAAAADAPAPAVQFT